MNSQSRLAPVLFMLAACGAGVDAAQNSRPTSSAGRLVLAIQSAQTVADGRRCDLAVEARNNTGAAALNVQAAWSAQTNGFGIISDFQFLGDFAAGEARTLRLGIYGAPCKAVRDLKLTRAVCVVGPAQDPPESCADRVQLEGGAGIVVRSSARDPA